MSSFSETRARLLAEAGISGKSGGSGEKGSGTTYDREKLGSLAAEGEEAKASYTIAKTGHAAFDEVRERLLSDITPDKLEQRRSKVADWADKYNQVMQGLQGYETERAGKYSTDVSGGYSPQIAELLQEYEGIRDYASRMGLTNGQRYQKNLQTLQEQIRKTNEFMAGFESEDAYNQYVAKQEDYEQKRTANLTELEEEIARLKEQRESAGMYQDIYDDPVSRLQRGLGLGDGWEDIRRKGSDALEEEIGQKQQYLDEARAIQEQERLAWLATQPDVIDLGGEAMLQDTKARAREHAQSPKVKAAEAERAYDAYLQSEERQQKLEEGTKVDVGAMLLQGLPGLAPKAYVDEKEQALKAEADYWRAQADAEDDQVVVDQALREIASWPEEDQEMLKAYVEERDETQGLFTGSNPITWLRANHEMGKNAAALYDKYGEERVRELAQVYGRYSHAQDAQQLAQASQEAASTKLGAVGHSALSVGAGLISDFSAIVGRVGEAANDTGIFKTAEEYTPGDAFSIYSSNVRGQTAQNIEEGNGVLGKVASIVYQGGMSALDSGARMAFTGNAGAAAALAASSSFTQAMSKYSAQGATKGQATAMALTVAGLEYATEKVPMEKLLNIAKNGGGLADVLKQALVAEPTTEELSMFGEILAEAAILRDKSSYNQQVGELVANGKSYDDAKKEADRGILQEAAETYFVSAVSGGFSAGGAAILGNATGNVQETDQQGQDAGAVLSEQQQQAEPAPQAENAPQVAQGAVETADILRDTVDQLKTNGTVSNKQAEAILADRAAVQQLMEQTGVEIGGTKSQQRDAVKAAIRQLAQQRIHQSVMDGMAEMGRNIEIPTFPEADPDLQRMLDETFGIDSEAGTGYDGGNTQEGAVYNGTGETSESTVRDGYPVGNEGRSSQAGGAIQNGNPALPGEGISTGKSGGDVSLPGPGGVADASPRGYNDDYVRFDGKAEMDTEGKAISEGTAKRLSSTTVVDDSGSPIAVYHGTPDMDFTVFEKGDTGFHFGTYDQAMKRIADKGTDSGRIFRTYLDIQNPIYTRLDIGRWDAGALAMYLHSEQVLTDAEYADVNNLLSKDTGYQSPAAVHLREILTSKGYDGVIYPNFIEGKGNSYMVFRDDQIIRSEITNFGESGAKNEFGASANDLRSLSQPEAKGTPNSVDGIPQNGAEVNDDLLYGNVPTEFLGEGVQRDRPNDVRPVEVPKTDAQGKRVSEFVGNAYGSALTPDSFTNTIQKLVLDGKLGHDVQTNEKSLELAAQQVAVDGLYQSVQKVRDTARSGKTSANDVAKATLLYNYLVGDTDQHSQEMAADVFTSLSQLATNSGRSLQLFSMFRQMTPDGQMMTIQQEINRYTDRLKQQGSVSKDFTLQTNDTLMQDYREAAEQYKSAKSPEEQKTAQRRMQDTQNAIYVDAAAQMPATFKAQWDAWRYMSMLGNAKTQVRNLVGNAAFMPYTAAKRTLGAAMEQMIPKEQRTKAVLNPLSQEDQQLRSWARNDAKSTDVKNALQYSAKLGDDVSASVIQEKRRIFDSDVMEKLRKASEFLPAEGDMLFKNREYSVSLASFLKARGYTVGDIEAGRVSDTVLNEGRNYAINEAMKATFNDCNAFSDLLANELRYKGDNVLGKALNTLGEGVLPFRRTPANIVVRAVENSPLGLLRGAWNAAVGVHRGKVSAATAIDQLAAGLTGTGAWALGYALARGIGGVRLRGSDVDEDEKRRGYQAYALEFSIGGKEYSYTIDWAAPANLPLFVGANIYSAFQDAGADPGLSKVTSFLYSTMTAFEPMLSLSCMSSLNDLLEAGKYAERGRHCTAPSPRRQPAILLRAFPPCSGRRPRSFRRTSKAPLPTARTL